MLIAGCGGSKNTIVKPDRPEMASQEAPMSPAKKQAVQGAVGLGLGVTALGLMRLPGASMIPGIEIVAAVSLTIDAFRFLTGAIASSQEAGSSKE